jgi:hypothetical protein
MQVEAMELNEMAENFPQRLTALGVNYDPKLLANMFSSRRGELNSRAFAIAGTLGLFVSAVMKDWVTGQMSKNMERRGEQLANVLSGLGPAFVKLGQALSLRPDLLPKPYLDALAKLQVCHQHSYAGILNSIFWSKCHVSATTCHVASRQSYMYSAVQVLLSNARFGVMCAIH